MRPAAITALSSSLLLAVACMADVRASAPNPGSARALRRDARIASASDARAAPLSGAPDADRACTDASASCSAQAAMPMRAVKRVVLVSIDGLRPDAITTGHKALHRLYLQGASPHFAHTIAKSATLPSHASMVTGVDMDQHGIDFNALKPERGAVRFPTIFSAAHAAGIPATMFVGKSKLKHLLTSPSDATLKVAGMKCKKVVDQATPTLRGTRGELVFLHFANPDAAGHKIGWMSAPYQEAVHEADACLGDVIDTIAESSVRSQTLLIVTSDHGGHQRSHGTRLDVDQRIPWYAWGAGVKRGRFSHNVHTTDTAATVLAALGLPTPQGMSGHPVSEAVQGQQGPLGMPLAGKPLERR
jgi:arylsulfatase A-like enzyme